MLSGDRYKTIELYKEHLEINSVTNPIHGPFTQGVLTRYSQRWSEGWFQSARLADWKPPAAQGIYRGARRMKSTKLESFADSKIRKPESYYITVGEVARQIGWHGTLDMTTKVELYPGQRKTSRAVATISKGTGKVRINNTPAELVTPDVAKELVLTPLTLLGELRNRVDITVQVHGGGFMGQALQVRWQFPGR